MFPLDLIFLPYPLSFLLILSVSLAIDKFCHILAWQGPIVMETLDFAKLLMEDQVWLNYLWDFETRGINLDFSSMLSSPGPDTD